MSNDTNDRLFERADYVKAQSEGTDIEVAINNLIINSDLEALEYLVAQAEAELSRQEFYAGDC